MAELPSEQELDTIRGKMLVNAANREELKRFLKYVGELEHLLDLADMEDAYGTEGWRHYIRLDD